MTPTPGLTASNRSGRWLVAAPIKSPPFERPIAEQGSENGSFHTSVASKKQPLFYKKLKWTLKKFRRMIFGYNARS